MPDFVLSMESWPRPVSSVDQNMLMMVDLAHE